jgi:uncharacterized spore protein YtfJ
MVGAMFLDDLQKRFSDMQTKVGARTVYGEPIEIDGRKVIPVASVRYAFGMGGGTGPKPEEADAPGGGGGGGGLRVRPVALIEVTDGKVKVEPIVDVSRLGMMAMLVGAWSVFWIAYTIRVVARSRQKSE